MTLRTSFAEDAATYDDVGNLVQRTDQIGQVTHYTYSDLYFLVSRTYPSSINDSFTFDLSGRMLSAQRGALPGFVWLDTFTYDGGDRVTKSVQNGRTISSVYNIPGRTRTLTYPGGRVITEKTDFRTRADHIDDAGSPPPIVQYTYDPANNVLSRNYRNGTTSSFSYNANNRTLSIAHKYGVSQLIHSGQVVRLGSDDTAVIGVAGMRFWSEARCGVNQASDTLVR